MDDFERKLAARLREPEPVVPAAVDAAVLAAGREAATAFGRRRRLRLVTLAAAAAAVLLVGTWLGLGLRSAGQGDRPFDVADAWRVAAGLERGARFDLDRDGCVDRRDADVMLARIVALEPRRRS